MEDVKTFFGMLGMILIVGSVFGITEEEIFKVHLNCYVKKIGDNS